MFHIFQGFIFLEKGLEISFFLGATSQDFSMLPTAIIKRLRLCHALIKQLCTHKKI